MPRRGIPKVENRSAAVPPACRQDASAAAIFGGVQRRGILSCGLSGYVLRARFLAPLEMTGSKVLSSREEVTTLLCRALSRLLFADHCRGAI